MIHRVPAPRARLAVPARLADRGRAHLLGRASLIALLAGSAAVPRAVAGGGHLSLQQALAGAGAAAARTTGNTAAINAGQQAAIGVANVLTASRRLLSLQQALQAQTPSSGSQGAGMPTGLTTSGTCPTGGLCPDVGYNQAGSGVWQGVSTTAPVTQTGAGGITTVTVNQTSPQAILNWSSFNVPHGEKLVFNQSAGGGAASSWTVLNRIDGPGMLPSMIFGAISAPGQVLVLNPNGVLFGEGAQVNLHSLVAGAISISDSQFFSTGIYGVFGSTKKPAVSANSLVQVDQGASIVTPAPATASDGGGSVILLAATVENDGTIETPAGQTILGGGTIFTLRTGYSVPANSSVTPGQCGSGGNPCSTVLGTEIDATGTGLVSNQANGFVAATTGGITLSGETIVQQGVLYSTTSVSRRGTIHLLTDTSDPKGSVTLAPGSLTYIGPDPNSLTADVSQRNDTPQLAYGANAGPLGDEVGLTDLPDRSRIEITTGGTVNFEDGSLTLANAGQVAVSAVAPAPAKKGVAATTGEIFVASGAQIDVSGLNDVVLPMSANTVEVNVQGFQLRDAPVNRDTGALANLNLTLDARQLITVAPSTDYDTPRDYTAGGLFEVSGELAQIQHSISEWSTVGGNVALQSDAVVTQPGSTINIAGGTIQYQAGSIAQTYLIGPGGQLFNANTAPANLLYSGSYSGFTIDHARWHISDTYTNPLLTPASISSPAYIEGRDAGTLTIAAPTALFDGTLNAGVQTGPLQTVSHSSVVAGTDPVTINQDVAPLAGGLVLADTPFPNSTAEVSFPTNVSITPATPNVASTLTAGGTLAASLIDTAGFGAGQLNGLGALTIEVGNTTAKGANLGAISLTGALTLAPGGTLTLAAPVISLDASITARSGSVTAETANPLPASTLTVYSSTQRGALSLGAGDSIDTRGEWTNLVSDPAAISGAAFINGGNVALISSGALSLGTGSLIDASAGAVFSPTLKGGSGGNITLLADDPNLIGYASATTQQVEHLAPVTLDGTVRSLGVTAGGTFTLAAPSIVIGNDVVPASGVEVALAPSFFASGFSDYVLNGFSSAQSGVQAAAGSANGVVVAPGTAVDVVEPVLVATQAAPFSPTGSDPNVPLSAMLFPEFVLNPATDSFQRRAGASLTLDSQYSGPLPQTGSGITIGLNASITVDTGQSVTLQSPSQITVDGAIHAPSGTITLLNTGASNSVNPNAASKTSIWIGPAATLDVAGRAVTGKTLLGDRVGEVFAGGSILVGISGGINDVTNLAPADAYVFVRPGAVLSASGAAANLDLQAGTAETGTAAAGQIVQGQTTLVGSAGGTIAFASDFGIYLQGTMQAAAGAPNAAGGELAVRLGDPGYQETSAVYPIWFFAPHEIVVSQTTQALPSLADVTPGDGKFVTLPGINGQAAVSANQVSAGGFGTLFLLARDQISFNGNVTLAASQSITLADYTTSATGTAGAVSVAAPYVLLAGAPQPDLSSAYESPLISFHPNIGDNNGQPFSQREPCIAGVSACYSTSLTVNAGLIDIEGDVRTAGAYADFYTGPTQTKSLLLDTDGFNAVNLTSSGDIRFVPANYTAQISTLANKLFLEEDSLETSGDLTLDAARIYPATAVDATVIAGLNAWGGKDDDQKKLARNEFYYASTLTVGSTGIGAQSAPLSAFGRIELSAANVVQDGDVQAPLGEINIGNLSGDFERPALPSHGAQLPASPQVVSVTLAAGSDTSVSAAGLTIPFGGTTDGTSYSFDGQALTLPAASLGGIALSLPSIRFDAPAITVAADATLDVAGGGTLVGGGGEYTTSSGGLVSQGFISGRGGSTDTLVTPFLTFNAKALTASAPSLAQAPVFAIVPGYASDDAPVTPLEGANAYAAIDVSSAYYGSVPQIGERITIGNQVPGLPAGTYTLLPSYYALLPGGYRVQLGGASPLAGSNPGVGGAVLPIGNGTYETTGQLGVAGTAIRNVTASALYLTPGSVVQTYSQYDQEGYAAYAIANAAVFGNPRPYLPQDAGAILVTLGQLTLASGKLQQELQPGFSFSGTALTGAAAGGYSAVLDVSPGQTTNLDILGQGGTPASGAVGILASTVDAVGAGTVFLGNIFAAPSDSVSAPNVFNTAATVVTVETGATLTAGSIFLLASNKINVEAGAEISTIGRTASLPDSATGVLFSPGADAVLVAANGSFQFPTGATGTAEINLGVCQANATCGLPTQILSGGFLGVFAGGPTTIAPGVVFGAGSLELDASTLIIGTPPTSNGTATVSGTALTQATLDQLIAGDPAAGIPALQSLQLLAGKSIDFFGDASLSTQDADGASALGTLVITTPAIYGGANIGQSAFGTSTTQTNTGTTTVALSALETASITTGTLVWNGGAASTKAPPGFVGTSISTTGTVTGSAGPTITTTTYSENTLSIGAQDIVIGYPGQAQAQNQITLSHTVLGFAQTDLTATAGFSANNHATLAAYESASVSATGTAGSEAGSLVYSGGALTITTPVLTTAPGGILGLATGGTLTLAGSTAPAGDAITGGLGGEIDLQAAALTDSARIALPSGRLVADATGNITLGAGATIDLAGPTVTIIDQQRGSFGGTAELTSATGNITEMPGASIDISATDANAGTLSATARAGSVNLFGSFSAGAPEGFLSGSVIIAANSLATVTETPASGTASVTAGNFAMLNSLFDAAGADGARSFEQTDVAPIPGTTTAVQLTVGNVTAQTVGISVDGGSLSVTGTINASGAQPGTINLASTGNLILAPGSVLDAAETVTHLDSLGEIIPAENAPRIELQVVPGTAHLGTLTLSSGATIDMAGPAGAAQTLGDLELDVSRTPDNLNADIEATGNISITGAAAIDVNAFRTYVAGHSLVSSSGTITEATMDKIQTFNKSFIDSAVHGGKLHGPLARELSGLETAYADELHLKPGVQIESGASGDLTVSRALNLANFRYASINPEIPARTGNVYGSGEAGVLWLRAADTLTIAGDITDGFALPIPATIAGTTVNLWGLSPLLAAGDVSWSVRLVAGADLAAADSRTVMSAASGGSAAAIGGGNLILSNRNPLPNDFNNFGLNVDVVRTGTGYLDLYAGGNFAENSPYGIYTAGTAIASAPNAPGVNYTTGGGDVTLAADGTAQGFVFPMDHNGQSVYQAVDYTNNLTNWLRFDSKGWWVDFGRLGGELLYTVNGLGTFGGGNVDVTVGGDAGNVSPINGNQLNPSGGGLDITVGTSGYTDPATGAFVVSGGGDIRLSVGGALNPAGYIVNQPVDNEYGVITDLRGQVSITAGAVGQIGLQYSAITGDPRPVNPYVSETFQAEGGLTLIIGDGSASIDTRGDLVLGGVGDGGNMGFSFYQPATAVRLYSAGGNLVPTTISDGTTYIDSDVTNDNANTHNILGTYFYYYAPILDAVAGSGSIYLEDTTGDSGIQLAPSPDGALNMLAEDSIYDGFVAGVSGYQPLRIEMSGAPTLPASELPGPLLPVQSLVSAVRGQATEKGATASGILHAADTQPTRFYAATGDVVGLQTGLVQSTSAGNAYIAATAVQIVAGNDVVGTGGTVAPYLQDGLLVPNGSSDLFLDNSATDISLIKAGHDVIYANADVAGPGVLEVQAGNNVYQGDQGILLSLGDIGAALTPLTRDAGAGITVLAGTGGGFNTTAFANLYLNPANLADPGTPLQNQTGKVERTYLDQLVTWLAARGYTGPSTGALAYFLALPQYEQTDFLLTVYYAELNQSGLDYNNPQSRFYHSYLEGQEAIRTLFANTDPTGKAPADGGGLTLFSGAGVVNGSFYTYDSAIRTEFGGAIKTAVPYGETLLGNYGIVPQATAGILTQGSGNIDMYSYGSVILGQSRVLTTLGGNVLIWMSSDGEINAGRGSKTTALTPPPNISYDVYGNVFLSPTVPSSGAGIGALAPIAGVPAGDVNLIAPVGSIDAGEAGVRASGNINVAALTVVNGANLQSGGKTTGVPTVSGPSAAAAAAAASASGQSQAAAQQTQPQRVVTPEPSVIDVDVVVVGSDDTGDQRKRRAGGA